MIDVDHLTKLYGRFRAVDGLSFSVGRGEVVGFLGPNGAGKTTTMRMLSTYLPPTTGRARLAGHDVLDEPLEVRRRLGYLPENVPLYPEMRVREYLVFRAKLKDVRRSKRHEAVGRVIERCRLQEVEQSNIGHLSKGYRQRVGLADSMIHDPAILILDEPTSGLDPIQIREVRTLIRELGQDHTLLLSTHIMQEVEAVCGRVIIIVDGRIAVDESLEGARSGSAVLVEAKGPGEAVRKAVEGVGGVRRVVLSGSDQGVASLHVEIQENADPRAEIAKRVVQGGWGLRRLEAAKSSLEERFVQAVRDSTAREEGETGSEAA